MARYVDERGPVGFIKGAVPDGAVVPDSWRALPALSPAERVELMVSVMGETVGEHLPRTLRGLRERCVDAELVVHGGEYFVVYTFIDGKGREECFTGGNPLRPSWPEAGEDGYADNVRRVWEHVPESVRAFYERTHDGFHPFALEDEGILPLREVRALAGDDCLDGVDDPGTLSRVEGCYMFYRYPLWPLAIDIVGQSPGRCDYWLPGRERRLGVDFWESVDHMIE